MEKQIEWVKPTLEMILPNKRCKCISGSLAGTVGVIKSVIKPGQPDSETYYLSRNTGNVNTQMSQAKQPSEGAKNIIGQMKMKPMFGVPHKVRIEFIETKESKQGAYVGITTTKSQFLNNWLIEK